MPTKTLQITEPSQLVDVETAAQRFGVSANTFLAMVREGRAPAPVLIGQRLKRWHTGQLTESIDRLAGFGGGDTHGYW